MNHKTFLVATSLLLCIFCGEALAMGLGGGSTRRGGRRGPQKDPKKEQEARDLETHKAHVQQMPLAEKCAALDTSGYDKFEDQLELSNEQKKRISELKQQIRERMNELEKAQDQARNNFKNVKEPDCQAAGVAMMTAMQACKSYKPTDTFDTGVNLILIENQRNKWKLLKSGGGAGTTKLGNSKEKSKALKDE